MIGRTLGHYQIVDGLGEGGMGVVFKARDHHLDCFVALKLLRADKLTDADRPGLELAPANWMRMSKVFRAASTRR